MLEYSQKKVFTSTGTTPWEDASWAQVHAIYVETTAASSAVYQIETRMNGGTSVVVISSNNLGASTVAAHQLTGAYDQLRVHLTDSTGTVTTFMRGNN